MTPNNPSKPEQIVDALYRLKYRVRGWLGLQRVPDYRKLSERAKWERARHVRDELFRDHTPGPTGAEATRAYHQAVRERREQEALDEPDA